VHLPRALGDVRDGLREARRCLEEVGVEAVLVEVAGVGAAEGVGGELPERVPVDAGAVERRSRRRRSPSSELTMRTRYCGNVLAFATRPSRNTCRVSSGLRSRWVRARAQSTMRSRGVPWRAMRAACSSGSTAVVSGELVIGCLRVVTADNRSEANVVKRANNE
jgi:hypothetical protein